MTILLWTVLALLSPAARAADGLTAWRAWFWSQPGGPLDGLPAPASAPAVDWREFEPPTGLRRAFGDASFSDALRGPDQLTRVLYRYAGDVFLAQRTGTGAAGWRHERVDGTGLEWGELALALDSRGRVHAGYELAGPRGKVWVHAEREPYGRWASKVVGPSGGTESPRFGASPEGGLALYFTALPFFPQPRPAAPPPAPRSLAWLWGFALLPLARVWLVARRLRARARLRSEAALIGRGLLLDVLVRPRGRAFSPARAGLVLLHARTPVLFMDGLRPSEAWLGPEWRLSEGRPGWIEAACGPVVLEVAPEAGLWPSISSKGARKLLDALRAERAVKLARLVRESAE
ncbi:MAG: hypothetical protein HY553_02770 [Elusimicrobia bacterium]|nr:hypothetical protein [Elusimicrobiota bacterium]